MQTDNELKDRLDKDIQKYLGNGGKVTYCKPFEFSSDKSLNKSSYSAFNEREAKRNGRSKRS
jgi:hypothetical protein